MTPIRTIYLLVVTTYRIWSVSALPGRHQKQPWMNFAKGRLQQRLLQAMTGVSQILPSYAMLFGYMLFKLFQNIVYLFHLVILLAFFWTIVDGLPSIEGTHMTSDVRCIVWCKQLTGIWVSSIGVDQAFGLDCLNLFAFFSVAGCHNLPKRFNTSSIATEIYCTKKINQIRSFLGEHGYCLSIQRAVILYWMNPVMAKCHQLLLISKLPSLEAHNAWWCSDAKLSFCCQFPTCFFQFFKQNHE